MKRIVSMGALGCVTLAATTGATPKPQMGPPKPQVAPLSSIPKAEAVAIDWGKVEAEAPRALDTAVGAWIATAGLTGIVNAVTAVPNPGISGPTLVAVMAPELIAKGVRADVANAIAGVCSVAWSAWASSYRYPAANWYPSFAAFPSPVAPPTPNIPAPFIAGASPGASQLSASSLKSALRSALGSRADDPAAKAVLDRFADAFSAAFENFRADAMWTQQMGTGPVPTFAPPYVPVGPVVGGTITPMPGGLIGSFSASSLMESRTSYEAKIGSHLVKLEGGSAKVGRDRVTLRGTVSLSIPGGAGRLVLRDAIMVLEQRAARSTTNAGAGAQQAQVQQGFGGASVIRPALANGLGGAPAGPTSWPMGRAVGTVSIEIGATKLTFDRAMIDLSTGPQGDSLWAEDTGGLCSTTFQPGTSLAGSEVRLVYKRNCAGNLWAEDADLKLRSGSVSGSGRVNAFGHTFQTAYTATPNQGILATAAWSSAGRGWQSFGINGAEFRVPSPKLSASWAVQSQSLALSFSLGKIEGQSAAKKPDGQPWVSVSVTPAAVAFGLDGHVTMTLPSLPQPARAPEQVKDVLCDATCGRLAGLGLAAMVQSGTGIPNLGQLVYPDRWHNQCHIEPKPRLGSDCTGWTVCPAGWDRWDDGGVKKCKLTLPQPPTMPSVPAKSGIKLDKLL